MVPGCQAPVRHHPQGLHRRETVLAVVIDLRPQDGLGLQGTCIDVGYLDRCIRTPSRRRDRTLSSCRTTPPTHTASLPDTSTTLTYLSLLGSPPSVHNPRSQHPRCPRRRHPLSAPRQRPPCLPRHLLVMNVGPTWSVTWPVLPQSRMSGTSFRRRTPSLVTLTWWQGATRRGVAPRDPLEQIPGCHCLRPSNPAYGERDVAVACT